MKPSLVKFLVTQDTPAGPQVPRDGAKSDFRAGWERARTDGVDIAPHLRKAVIEAGVHPSQVENYIDALMKRRGSQTVDMNAFKKPVPSRLRLLTP